MVVCLIWNTTCYQKRSPDKRLIMWCQWWSLPKHKVSLLNTKLSFLLESLRGFR